MDFISVFVWLGCQVYTFLRQLQLQYLLVSAQFVSSYKAWLKRNLDYGRDSSRLEILRPIRIIKRFEMRIRKQTRLIIKKNSVKLQNNANLSQRNFGNMSIVSQESKLKLVILNLTVVMEIFW